MILYNSGYTELKGGTNMDCGECKYFSADGDNPLRDGVCRLMPPICTGHDFMWPPVKRELRFKDGRIMKGDWCGQFVEAEE